jgi:hypothetical protein
MPAAGNESVDLRSNGHEYSEQKDSAEEREERRFFGTEEDWEPC